MDIAGEGDRIITTWDGLVHWGMAGMVGSGVAGLVLSDLGSRSFKDGKGGGFNGAFPISSGGEALGKMTSGLVVVFRSWVTTHGVSKEG